MVCFMLAAGGLLQAPRAAADPWLWPGDLALRHDIQLLADAGILRTPMTTWPLSWPDVARDVLAQTFPVGLAAGYDDALMRVQRAARREAQRGFSGVAVSIAGAEQPIALRGFANAPRERGELAAGGSWLGDRLAAAVHVAAVADASDDQTVRLDESYVGLSVGNFMISAGAMSRWWGPGWDGSLILSTNARPIPSVTVERNYTDASRRPMLRWFGPWRASLAIGQADGSDVAVADVRFLAARVNFKPRPWLEFGLSRTAQWCGAGRPCGFGVLEDLLLGRDNRDASLTINDEPGNQMAGYDFRLRSPWRALPVAVYGQMIGEDEAGGLPSKFLGLVGAELWGSAAHGTWRARFEYADTSCNFSRRNPQFDCAYRNGLYPQGYTYRGRGLGHSLDSDGRMLTLGLVLARPSGTTWSASARSVELNRDGALDPVHALSPLGASELDNVEVQMDTAWFGGALSLGLGYDDYSRAPGNSGKARGFVRYSRGL